MAKESRDKAEAMSKAMTVLVVPLRVAATLIVGRSNKRKIAGCNKK